jgi:hypothetical protein
MGRLGLLLFKRDQLLKRDQLPECNIGLATATSPEKPARESMVLLNNVVYKKLFSINLLTRRDLRDLKSRTVFGSGTPAP